jgi:hypothetical protein
MLLSIYLALSNYAGSTRNDFCGYQFQLCAICARAFLRMSPRCYDFNPLLCFQSICDPSVCLGPSEPRWYPGSQLCLVSHDDLGAGILEWVMRGENRFLELSKN